MEGSLLASLLWGVPAVVVTSLALLSAVWWSLSYGYLSIQNGRLRAKPVNLPPGTMGWPVIGETFEFLADFRNFVSKRSNRYGEIFKTHLEGRPTVVTTSPEAYRFVMSTNAKALLPLYQAQVRLVLGRDFVNFLSGSVHSMVRGLHQSHLLSIEALKEKIGGIEELALTILEAWAPETTLSAFRFAIEDYTLSVGMLAVFGSEGSLPEVRALQAEYSELERGFTAIIPVDLPGTQWRKTMNSRRKVSATLDRLIEKRQAKGVIAEEPDGILDSFLAQKDMDPGLVKDNIIGVLFASNATTATTLTWILKFLHDFPEHLASVKVEQEKIRSRKGSNEPLNWTDIRDMTFTSMVFQEALRIPSIIDPLVTREAMEDVVYKGFVIPKGWRVKPMFMLFHVDQKLWPEPEKFDPSRFERPRGNAYAPFGAGEHICVGNEFAKMETLIFLHHFVTKFRWQVLEDGPWERLPLTAPHKGLPVKIALISSDT